jgi:hypothetical protein
MVILRSPDSSHIVPPAGSSHNYCRYSAPVQPFRPLRTVALLAVSYRPRALAMPTAEPLEAGFLFSPPRSALRRPPPFEINVAVGYHPLPLLIARPARRKSLREIRSRDGRRAGFDAATCHWSCWRLRGARSTLFRRAEEDPSALPRRILPIRRGAEARRFNRLLIDADLIKGL